MTLADRIVIMQGGAIQQIGTPDEIYSDPANTFVASFIGAPPMNIIDGELKGGTFTSTDIEITGLSIKAEGPIKLGVRPEDCAVVGSGKSRRREQIGNQSRSRIPVRFRH
jgi:multiple sugar transport system ATP-binding protein